MKPQLFTIGSGFAETLARGLKARAEADAFALSDCIVYLPTRRAARSFGEAFAKVLGGAALLPQFRALNDSDEDDLLFDASQTGMELPPAIAPIRRQLMLATLIQGWSKARGDDFNFAQSAALADSLAAVMDEAETHAVDLAKLADLAPLSLAQHWEQVTAFLTLVRDAWPELLARENRLNPAARRNTALSLLARRLEAEPPLGMVIAAGSTGSIPATANLLRVIANLPRGAVILPGLDQTLDAESWDKLDPGHPQFGLKQLLDSIGAPREDVRLWHTDSSIPARESLLRETMRPAPTTDAWRALADKPQTIAQGLHGVTLAAANDPAQEALVIALALRETLETEGRTAALITPDRNLARRVAGELTRWGIAIDNSAGRPLAHTSAGAFLCLLADAADAAFAPVPLLALLKHPFATLGEEPAPFRAMARALDRALRGPRPDPGLDGITKAIAHARTAEGLAAWWAGIAALLSPLEQAFAQAELPLPDLIDIHVTAAQHLACKPETECPLWRGLDGDAAANLIAQFREGAADLPGIAPRFYPALLRGLAMKVPVRPRPGRNRAIAILGPLEARLQSFDLTILGGLNEGTWPSGTGADPWFSRPMRETLGLPQPERGIGLAAHDFTAQLSSGDVLLTRALKVDGTPSIPSRWLQRLIQLTQGLKLDIPASPYLPMARALADVAPGPRLQRPAPKPPVPARPRQLSVTAIETWLRDPYAIYARHVLKLKPLDPLDDAVGPLERGNAFHKALELFVQRHPGALPDGALAELINIAGHIFDEMEIPHGQRAIWRPRFANAARSFLEWERGRRETIALPRLEIKGRMTFDAPAGPFTLTCTADRIDLLKGGGAAIIDYKTGSLPQNDALARFLAPQLPLEGAILAAGGFDGLAKARATELIYLRFSGNAKVDKEKSLEEPLLLSEEAEARLKQRIAWFDDPATPYLSRVAPQNARISGDYDHLARVREWSPSGWSEE